MSGDYCAAEGVRQFDSMEMKEEPMEFKDEPLDDIDEFKPEEPFVDARGISNNIIIDELLEIKDEPLDDFNQVKQEKSFGDVDKSYDLKEEPLEIIDEPIDNFYDVKQEDPIADVVCTLDNSNEVKEEPLEIKDEPIDNFDDIKEEEPIADLYCPSTGTSRSLNHTNIVNCEGMGTDIADIAKERGTRQDPIETTNESGKNIVYRICDACGEKTYCIYVAPMDPSRARKFYNNLIKLTTQQIWKVQLLSKNGIHAAICNNHFKLTSKEHLMITRANISKKILPSAQKRSRVCNLCEIPAMSYHVSPSDPSLASAFFSNLIKLTPQQREKSEFFIKHKRRATICTKHMKPIIVIPPLQNKTNNSSSIKSAKDFEKKSQCSVEEDIRREIDRKCDLCGELASPFYFSPANSYASAYFSKLVELTTEQRNKSEYFIKNKLRATICSKHYKTATLDSNYVIGLANKNKPCEKVPLVNKTSTIETL